MSKWLRTIVLLALLVSMSAPVAYAAALEPLPQTLEKGTILKVFDGASLDLDGDGTVESISFTADSPDLLEGKYTLKVNDSEVSGEGVSLTGWLHAMRLGTGYPNAYLLVSEYGPSDDNACYIYSYSDGKLTFAGIVPSAPDDIYVSGTQFTGIVRGKVLQTWFRPADYIIAASYRMSEDGTASDEPRVVEVPRATYPMGTIVTAKMKLPLRVSPADEKAFLTVKKGEKVILAATDDAAWLYVAFAEDHEGGAEENYSGGWLRLEDVHVVVGNKPYVGSDVFDGLFFAD